MLCNRRVGAAGGAAARTPRPPSTDWHAQDCRRPAAETGSDVRRPWRHHRVPSVGFSVRDSPGDGGQMAVAAEITSIDGEDGDGVGRSQFLVTLSPSSTLPTSSWRPRQTRDVPFSPNSITPTSPKLPRPEKFPGSRRNGIWAYRQRRRTMTT